MLDHAIMIAFCKNIKATGGNNTIPVASLWDRLMDLLDWADARIKANALSRGSHTMTDGQIEENDIDSYIFPQPSYEVFLEAVTRLLETGLLRNAITSNRGKSWNVSEDVLAYNMATLNVLRDDAPYTVRMSSMIGCPMEYGDVTGALRGKTYLVSFVD